MILFERLFPADFSLREAVLFEGRKLTYAELRAETVRVAAVLKALGVSNGDRVALLLADSPEFIAAFVAIISIGAIAVPINLALGREDQLFILKDCGACAAVVEGSAATALFQNSPPPTDLKNLILVRRSDDGVAKEIPGVHVEDFANGKRRELTDLATMDADTDADAFILYTSGSTGEPKGAVHTQGDIFYTNETFCR